eukprot:3389680-Alexandrium_andersonii.AAC.1
MAGESATPWSDHFTSVHERWPDLSGRILQDMVRKTYVVVENATLSFVHPRTKEKLMTRDPLNPRDQRSAREQYKRVIQQEGIKLGARNEVLVVPSRTDDWTQLSGGEAGGSNGPL